MTGTNTRFRELDFFRAIAALLVVGFHYFSRWALPSNDVNLYPYGGAFAEFFLFRNGYLGVDFFFLISGFVIALTLERSSTLAQFALRRAARLLPAMFVCSLITLFVVQAFTRIEHFRSEATLWNLLPSWTFTDPRMWSDFAPVTDWIDASYWSLAVEVKFYVWAAILYFSTKDKFARNFFIFSLACALELVVATEFQAESLFSFDRYFLLSRYSMLFSAGIFLQMIHRDPKNYKMPAFFVAACFAVDLLCSDVYDHTWRPSMMTAAFKATFFLAMFVAAMGWRLPRWRILDLMVSIGLASYPLYLVHQNVGVSLLNRAMGLDNAALGFVFALGMAALAIGLSLLLRHFVEQPGRRLILSIPVTQQIPHAV